MYDIDSIEHPATAPPIVIVFNSGTIKGTRLYSRVAFTKSAKVIPGSATQILFFGSISIISFKSLRSIFSSEYLGRGEKETIEICIKNKGIPVTDDHQAINNALNFGLKPKTSEIILLDFLRNNIINYQEFKAFFKELALIKSLKSDIILFFKNKAKEIVNKKKKLQGEN